MVRRFFKMSTMSTESRWKMFLVFHFIPHSVGSMYGIFTYIYIVDFMEIATTIRYDILR